MKPEEVPDELLQAVRNAPAPPPSDQRDAEAWARVILAAALPLHEKQVREQVIEELATERQKIGDNEGATLKIDRLIGATCRGLSIAIEIVRGEQP